jgi:hypothetical protein
MNKPLTVVCAVCDSDRDQLIRLFEWIRDLQDRQAGLMLPRYQQDKYDLLIIDTASYGSVEMQQVEEVAKRCFSRRSFCGELPVASWPQGPNASFLMACKLVETPFLWLEPDCVPMRPGWLDELADEYYSQKKPFMGTIVKSDDPRHPDKHMTGCSIYPAYAKEFYHESMDSIPWDLFAAKQVLPFVNDTKLVHHFYGEPGLPPTFVDYLSSDHPKNALPLDFIPKKAALFHRCKDSSLIEILRNQLTNGVHQTRN